VDLTTTLAGEDLASQRPVVRSSDPASFVSTDGRRRLQRAVLRSARSSLRPFPWRATRDPWRILVSEVMLQQTQARRVVAHYVAFVDRFPTVEACAAATPGDVVRAWAGLGYNRRAMRLHAAASCVRDRFGGTLPGAVDQLEQLPGVGPYTARAVAAFALEQSVAVVDTNIRRVLCRSVAGSALAPRDVQALADTLVPADDAWEWNQGLMEIGAVHCTAREPRCGGCPLRGLCAWRTGPPGPDPCGRARPQPRFPGSDRQGRGRLVHALRSGPLRPSEVPAAAGWPDDPERARTVADRLVAEGIAQRGRGGVLRLP
jgi:A/G-specific adenine glycosylase